jgi:ABC-2 type transport system permease protein
MTSLLLHQTRYDLLTLARNREGRFFTLLLPVMFLVIFVSVFGNNHIGPEHVKSSTYYVPGIAALAVMTAAFSNLVISITAQRESGVLKRRRATPVPAAVLVAARALTSLVVATFVTAVVIGIGAIAFGVHVAAGGLGALVLTVMIGAAALACIGYAAAGLISSADAAQPTVLALTLPLAFISGVFIPSVRVPSALHTVAEVFPLQHLVAAMDRGFLPGGTGVAWGDLAILALWGVAGLAVALRRFRWVPAASAA